MNTERTYPYTGWVLQPSFKPKAVVFKEKFTAWNNTDYGDNSEDGKTYPRSEIYATKADAIAGGWALLNAQQERIDKMVAVMAKKRAALCKGAA